MYCPYCGAANADSSRFCTGCGKPMMTAPAAPAIVRDGPAQQLPARPAPGPVAAAPAAPAAPAAGSPRAFSGQAARTLRCPQCGSADVTMQMFQENLGTTTVSRTRSKYKQKGHGLLWWLLIGWWWWIVDLCLWIFLFPIRAIIALTKKKKYKGKSTTVEQTVNQVAYKTMCFCSGCGSSWEQGSIVSSSRGPRRVR